MSCGLVDCIEFIWHGMRLGLSYCLLDELLQVYELWMDNWRYSMAALQWADMYDMAMKAFGQ